MSSRSLATAKSSRHSHVQALLLISAHGHSEPRVRQEISPQGWISVERRQSTEIPKRKSCKFVDRAAPTSRPSPHTNLLFNQQNSTLSSLVHSSVFPGGYHSFDSIHHEDPSCCSAIHVASNLGLSAWRKPLVLPTSPSLLLPTRARWFVELTALNSF
jgi:hypothetical protein